MAPLSRAEGGCGLGSHHHITHSRLLSSLGTVLRGHVGPGSSLGLAPCAFCASQTCGVAAASSSSWAIAQSHTAFGHPCGQLLSHPLPSPGGGVRGVVLCPLGHTPLRVLCSNGWGVESPSHHQAQLWEGVPLEPHPCLGQAREAMPTATGCVLLPLGCVPCPLRAQSRGAHNLSH